MQPFERLEHEWARFNDLDPAGMVACSSGTAALHLALEAFQLPSYSEVIVPDFTMVACPRAVAMAGLRPVFVDCDDRLCLRTYDVQDTCDTVSGIRPKAVMPVHVYGRRCDMEGVFDWAEHYDLRVVEDLAEAHGVRPHDKTDAACWSHYKNKQVAGEEGGTVWFRDPAHAKLARQLRSLGFTDAHDYNHVPRGHNYRMSNAHAELILRNWNTPLFPNGDPVIEIVFDMRRAIESWYDEFCPAEWRQPPREAVWVYDLRVSGMTSETQDRVVRTLREAGIQARHGFKPMHAQTEFKDCRRVGGENAERASREVIYLPVAPGSTTRADAERAFALIRSIVPRT